MGVRFPAPTFCDGQRECRWSSCDVAAAATTTSSEPKFHSFNPNGAASHRTNLVASKTDRLSPTTDQHHIVTFADLNYPDKFISFAEINCYKTIGSILVVFSERCLFDYPFTGYKQQELVSNKSWVSISASTTSSGSSCNRLTTAVPLAVLSIIGTWYTLSR